MWEFIIVLLILCAYKYDISGGGQHKEAFIRLIYVVLTLMSGLAYYLGGDVRNAYQPFFEKYTPTLSKLTWHFLQEQDRNGFEAGWLIFTSLCKTICPSWYFMKTIYAAVVNAAFFKVIQKHSPYVFCTLLMYVVLVYPYIQFEILRQGLASCFVFLALSMFRRKKWLFGALFVGGAYLFHHSAIVFLIAPFFYIGFKNLRFSILWVVLIVAIYFLTKDRFFNILTGGEVGAVEEYQKYFFRDRYQRGVVSWATIVSYIFHVFVPIITLALMRQKGKSIAYQPELFMSIILLLFTIPFPIFSRLDHYVDIFRLIIIVEFFFILLQKVDLDIFGKVARLSVLLVYLGAIGYSKYYSASYGDGTKVYNNYYPYSSVITKKMPQERMNLFNERI